MLRTVPGLAKGAECDFLLVVTCALCLQVLASVGGSGPDGELLADVGVSSNEVQSPGVLPAGFRGAPPDHLCVHRQLQRP